MNTVINGQCMFIGDLGDFKKSVTYQEGSLWVGMSMWEILSVIGRFHSGSLIDMHESGWVIMLHVKNLLFNMGFMVEI